MVLLTPLKYLKIRYRSKALYGFVMPALISVALTWLVVFWADATPVFGKDGYLAGLQNLLTILGGFFIAALTLVTTADLPILKEPVSGRDPPTLPNEKAPLSRKRFLAYLFGYLSTSSFLLVGISFIANIAATKIAQSLHPIAGLAVKAVGLAAYNFWLAHVFVATMLGMFYFTERLQVSDLKSRVGKPEATPSPLDDVES